MTIVNLGSLTVGGAVPGADAAVTAGIAGINGALPDITARLAALADFNPLPVNFVASQTMAASIAVNLTAAIGAGLSPPDLSAQILAVNALIDALEAAVAAVNAQLTILTDLTAPLAEAGIGAYAYDGTIGALGGEIGTAVGGSGSHCNALVLLTTTAPAWAALSEIMKVTP